MAGVAAMFDVLATRLAAARAVEGELDRLLANRFNPLDYLRTDELGLELLSNLVYGGLVMRRPCCPC